MKGRVLQIVSQVMQHPVDQIDEHSSPDTIAAWDSLRHMNLVLALEEEFGVRFSHESIVEMLSVESIISAIAQLVSRQENDSQR